MRGSRYRWEIHGDPSDSKQYHQALGALPPFKTAQLQIAKEEVLQSSVCCKRRFFSLLQLPASQKWNKNHHLWVRQKWLPQSPAIFRVARREHSTPHTPHPKGGIDGASGGIALAALHSKSRLGCLGLMFGAVWVGNSGEESQQRFANDQSIMVDFWVYSVVMK